MWASCTRPGYTRTSWNVGLATSAGDPAPRATPRTNVVLPAPRSPSSRSRSPCRSWRPKLSPAASVSAAELVTTSSKVVVAAQVKPERRAVGADHPDRGVLREDAQREQAGAPNHVFGTDANQLGLLAAREGHLPGGALGQGDIGRPDDAASVRGAAELFHLA